MGRLERALRFTALLGPWELGTGMFVVPPRAQAWQPSYHLGLNQRSSRYLLDWPATLALPALCSFSSSPSYPSWPQLREVYTASTCMEAKIVTISTAMSTAITIIITIIMSIAMTSCFSMEGGPQLMASPIK